MAPAEADIGQALSDEMIETVRVRTEVRAAISKRWQRGGRLCFFLEGPPSRLAKALELVRELMVNPVGGDGHADDNLRQPPRGKKDAWPETYSEDGTELTTDGLARESHGSEGEAWRGWDTTYLIA